jgi:hypothetical protein
MGTERKNEGERERMRLEPKRKGNIKRKRGGKEKE